MTDSDDSAQTSSRIMVTDEESRPTRVRWHVMALLVIVSALTFLDRLNLSIAGKFIQDQYHLPNQTMGWILSAFVLGYALFQVPGGWLADRYGPRVVVTVRNSVVVNIFRGDRNRAAPPAGALVRIGVVLCHRSISDWIG